MIINSFKSKNLNSALIVLSCGLTIHLALFLCLAETFPQHPKTIEKPNPITLEIIILPKPANIQELKLSHQDQSSSKPKSYDKNNVDSSKSKAIKNSTKSPKRDQAKYGTFLPEQGELSVNYNTMRTEGSAEGISSSKHNWAKHNNLDQKRGLIRTASKLRTIIDIPLSARAILDEGKATARISRRAGSITLTLKELSGMAILRAVLFEQLLTKEVKDSINYILDTLAVQDMTLVIHMIKGSHDSANADSFRWNENRLDVYITKGKNGFSKRGFNYEGGLSLSYVPPDDKADRTKEIDEDHFKRLRESPAYRSILNNYHL